MEYPKLPSSNTTYRVTYALNSTCALPCAGRPLHKMRVPSLPCLAIGRTKQVCLALPCDCPDTGAPVSPRHVCTIYMCQHCFAFLHSNLDLAKALPCLALRRLEQKQPCLALPCEGLSEGSLAFPSICTALPCKAGAQLCS